VVPEPEAEVCIVQSHLLPILESSQAIHTGRKDVIYRDDRWVMDSLKDKTLLGNDWLDRRQVVEAPVRERDYRSVMNPILPLLFRIVTPRLPCEPV
jgi:hypothetical protein